MAALAVLACWRSVVDTPARYTDFEANSERFTLLSVVRGTSSTITTRRGALNAARRSLTSVAQLLEARRTLAIDRHDEGGDELTPLLVGRSADRDVGHRRVLAQDRLDRFRPHVLAAGDDQVALASVDGDESLVVDRSEIAGREPAVGVRGSVPSR